MRMTIIALTAFIALCGPLGCADSKISGKVDGEKFGSVESSIFMRKDSGIQELQLLLTNYPEACITYSPYFDQGASPSEEGPLHALTVRFYFLEELAVGTFPIVANDETYEDQVSWVHAGWLTHSDTGWQGPTATSGSITLETLDDSTLTGTLEATLETGDVIEAIVVADLCDLEDF